HRIPAVRRGLVLSSPKTGSMWSGRRLGRCLVLSIAFCGIALYTDFAKAASPEAAVSGASSDPDAGSSTALPFDGNVELKAKLDKPGKMTVAGDRVRDDLLRRFYADHGYQTVWDAHPAQTSALWNAVMRAGDHGLDPATFHRNVLGDRGPALS